MRPYPALRGAIFYSSRGRLSIREHNSTVVSPDGTRRWCAPPEEHLHHNKPQPRYKPLFHPVSNPISPPASAGILSASIPPLFCASSVHSVPNRPLDSPLPLRASVNSLVKSFPYSFFFSTTFNDGSKIPATPFAIFAGSEDPSSRFVITITVKRSSTYR